VRQRAAVWLGVLVGWTVIAAVFAASNSLTYVVTYQPPQWARTFKGAAAEWYPWAALTPIVVWLATRLSLSRTRWAGRLALLAALGLPVSVVKLILTAILRGLGGVSEYPTITNVTAQYLIYWMLVAAAHAAENYRAGQERALHASELEARLAETRLQLLKMQLQPHFLFNTLNTIAELVHENPAAADRMIGGLSRLLRDTLDSAIEDVVPLERELDLLQRYLRIQEARFGDRLSVRIEAAEDVRSALVPVFILQPLVENAIKHGLGARLRAGRIDVRVSRHADTIILDVQDDGEGFAGDTMREGVGLGNTRARLQELYGQSHAFEVDRVPAGGALVRITIPFRTAAPAS
jgi:two-component system, LytTR family, sensor kinase